MDKQNNYYAFISYNSTDEKWAKWLHERLEHYHIPVSLCKQYKQLPKKIKPIFWYKADLNGTVLQKALQKELFVSRYLIVICSPNAAKSLWVNDEVQAFIDQGKLDYIIPFIVSGTPFANDINEECFPKALRELPREKILRGPDINDGGKKKALVNVISTMFDLPFDILWDRNRRYEYRKRASLSLIALLIGVIMCGIWFINQSFDVNISLSEDTGHNAHLYASDGTLSFIIQKDTIVKNVDSLTQTIHFNDIPGKYRWKAAELHFNMFGFNNTISHTTIKKNIKINISRNEATYGVVKGYVRDMNTDNFIPEAEVSIGEFSDTTNNNGYFCINIPLSHQRAKYHSTIKYKGRESKTQLAYPAKNGEINTLYW